jgi:hypothetical protein
MEIMEMQQVLMERLLVYYYKLESNAGLPAPKSAGYYYFKADTAALTQLPLLHGVTGSGTPNGWPDNGFKITI